MAILEALGSGCAIVSTAVGGIPEILQTVGWPLVPPNDSKALSEAIGSVYQMTEAERNQKRESGKQTVAALFSKEASVKKIEELYQSFIPHQNANCENSGRSVSKREKISAR